MGIASVDEIYSGRSGSQDRTWFRRYTRTFRVVTDDPLTGPVMIRQHMSGIFIGKSYQVSGSEVDSGAFAENIRAESAGGADGQDWIVTVDYGPYDASVFPANKLEWPLRISWGSSRYERVLEEDINGNAVVNSAGDPFDPPATIDDSRPVLNIIRNEATYDPKIAGQYKDRTNSDTFLGYPPGSWKSILPTAELKLDNDIGWYAEVTYQFEIRDDPQSPEGWKLRILDKGLKYLDGGELKAIVLADGTQATSPVLLDGAGGVNDPDADPAYLEFDGYPAVAFSTLGFDFANAPAQSWD